ncbi:MAG: LuxR C-terminal-related transcriptional regulator, partial [Solirubrobacteraceae bacterium]
AFPHPLARSAVYAAATPEQRRAAHRALADALPDRDLDRRAWHLAAAATGTDEAASAALEQAGTGARRRSAYGDAAAAFERGARLTADDERRARLLRDAAETAWLAGLATRASALLDEARETTAAPDLRVRIDRLAGEIAVRRGPVMRGHAMLVATAARAEPDAAVAMLADAGCACLYAGEAEQMLATAERAAALADGGVSPRSRFLASASLGMAQVLGDDAAAGTRNIHAAIALAEDDPALRDDPELLPWLAIGPIFLRERGSGRPLVDHALDAARRRAAVGALPRVLNLIARDQATTDHWARADATYREAIDLARESGQQTELAFGAAGLAWLQARRGHADECRAYAAEAEQLSGRLGTRLPLLWASMALGELELGAGAPERAAERFAVLQALLRDFAITDVDLSPVPELVDALVRTQRREEAAAPVAELLAAAEAKGQPWSLARALRAAGLAADDDGFADRFERALELHARTPDSFETARTRLAYGERLRRGRERRLAREQLRAALEAFERLDAAPWAERARAELAATGETLRRRDPSAVETLTPQELRIAHVLAAGRTTREAAAALFLSPKTVEFHLRSVYRKLDIHSRAELAAAVGDGHAAG